MVIVAAAAMIAIAAVAAVASTVAAIVAAPVAIGAVQRRPQQAAPLPIPDGGDRPSGPGRLVSFQGVEGGGRRVRRPGQPRRAGRAGGEDGGA